MTTEVRNRSELADLLKRIDDAAGPSRRLDDEINRVVLGYVGPMTSTGSMWNGQTYGPLPAPTHYLDHAVFVVEKKLPGCNWRLQKFDGDRKASAIINREHETKHFDIWVDHQGATPALALCAALLRALIACEPQADNHTDS